LGFKRDWGLVGKTGVESDAVIEDFDIVEDGSASLGESGEAVMIDQFVFEATKEAFDKSVVVAVAFSFGKFCPALQKNAGKVGSSSPFSGGGGWRLPLITSSAHVQTSPLRFIGFGFDWFDLSVMLYFNNILNEGET
jgi:hypothetical protein